MLLSVDRFHHGAVLGVKGTVPAPHDVVPAAGDRAPKASLPDGDDGKTGIYLTTLGVRLLSQNARPAVAVDAVVRPVLNARVKDYLTPVATVKMPVSTAPRYLPHADVWMRAIKSGLKGEEPTVAGVLFRNSAFATIDGMGNFVEAPLIKVVQPGKGGSASKYTTRPLPALLRSNASTAGPIDSNTVPLDLAALGPDPEKLSDKDIKTLTPQGFILSGDVKALGLLDARIYSSHGVSSKGFSELLMLGKGDEKVNIDSLFKGDQDLSFGGLNLKSVNLIYYDQPSPHRGRVGSWLEADIGFDGPLKPIGNDIQYIFGQKTADVHIATQLAMYRCWNKPFMPSSLNMIATLPGMSMKFGSNLEFVTLGVGISSTKSNSSEPPFSPRYSWGWSFFGTAKVTVPHSQSPLIVDYSVEKYMDTSSLNLTARDEWRSACGVNSFHLNNVTFTAEIEKSSGGSKELSFEITASWVFSLVTIDVLGAYSLGAWSFSLHLGEIDWPTLCAMYEEMFDAPLVQFDHDVEVDNLTLSVESSKGNLIAQGSIKVHEYASANATLELSNKGIHIRLDVGKVTLDSVILESASVEVIIGKQDNSTSNSHGTGWIFTIAGVISFHGMQLQATVYFDKDPDHGTIWLLAARFGSSGKNEETRLSSIAKPLEVLNNTPFDFVIEDVAFVASNSTRSPAGYYDPYNYPIKKGFQMFANLGSIHFLNKILGSDADGLILELGIEGEQSESLKIGILLPGGRQISLKPHMKSGSIDVGLDIVGSEIGLTVSTDFSIEVSGQATPLTFRMELLATELKAEGLFKINNNWNNPFNISEKLTILAPIEVGLGFTYVGAVYPNELDLKAAFAVGNTMGSAVLAITENPKEGVVQVHVADLGITQIIQFASLVLDTALPTPSKDYLLIKQLDLSISGGATVESVYYPPGASFHASVLLFGKLATVDCIIDKALPGMSFAGSLEHFSLGPLTVKGAKGINAEFQMQISKATQHLYLDGEIDIFGLTASIHLLAELHPVQLQFETTMAFSNLFSFTLAAQLTGSIDSLQDVANTDFTLTATLEQHILDHMMAQVNTQLLSIKHAADESLEKAHKALDDAEKALQAEIDKKEAELNAKKAAWDNKNDQAQASINATNRHKADREKQLQADVDAAKKAFDDEIAALQRDLDAKTQEMSNTIRAAEGHVSSVKADVDGKVNEAIADLRHKQDELNRQEGDVDRSFHDAQDRVNQAQGDLDSVRRHLNDVENDLHNCHWWQWVGKAAVVAEVEIELHAKEFGFDVERGVLELAQKAYDGPVCNTLKGAISLAEGGLAEAREKADEGLDTANKVLEAANKVQGAIVQGAKDALAAAQKGSQHLHLWDIAKKALTDVVEAENALVQAAEEAVLTLTKSAEWVAYKTAQGALEVARAGTHEIDVAKTGLKLVEKDVDAVADAAMWLVGHAGNVFNITKITLEGSLQAATKNVKLKATIIGKFANKDLRFSIRYTPGDAVQFVKDAFEAVWTEVKKDVKGFFAH